MRILLTKGAPGRVIDVAPVTAAYYLNRGLAEPLKVAPETTMLNPPENTMLKRPRRISPGICRDCGQLFERRGPNHKYCGCKDRSDS